MRSKLLRMLRAFVSGTWISLLGLSSLCLGRVAVTTHHNDTSRTGQNLSETILNTSNVSVNTFGKLFSRTVDGQIYAQPLYVPNLPVNGTTRNVVYVATQNNSVYAFDADDPAASSPLWQVNFGTPVPSTDVDPTCADITPQIGITSTPVIDTSTSTIYVAAKTKNTSNNSYHFSIHALGLLTGTEKFGGPTEITAQVPGTGVESVGGTVTLDPLQQFNRPGLLLLNGVVYVAFGGACETPPWHGWILGYSASTLQQVAVLNTTPNGSDGGIWGGGQGLLADSANNIYVMTGNGTFDATTGGDYGDSVLKISTASGLSIVDYFTPTNQAALDAADLDLGSGGPMALPGTNLIVGSGKDGIVRVVDTTNLGEFSATTNNNVQNFQGTTGVVFMGAPIYWNSPNNGPVIYIWSGNDFLKAYQLVNGTFLTTPISQSSIPEALGYSNSVPLSLSANGNQAGTGIVWGSGAFSGNANQTTVTGILRAFDATDLTNELWDSKQNAARDDVGSYAKLSPPTIANGRVYLATFSNQLLVYGLFADFSASAAPASVAVIAGQSGTSTITVTAPNGFTGVVTLTCSAGLPTGASCAFVPPSVTLSGTPVSSTLTLTTSATTPAATSTVTVTGTSGLLTHDTTVGLTVTPAPDFTIAATALSPATISAGAAATSTITIAPANGFNGSVSLTCNSIAPVVTPPPTCSFNPASVAGGSGTSTLTVSSSTTTPTGLFNVTVSGTSGSLSHTAPVSFTVTAAQAADFTVAATALSPASISPGGTATSTITIAPTNGFTGAVTLTCSSITPAATRAPACSFNPSSVANGSGTSTLTVSTTPATSASIASQSGGVFYAIWLPIVGLTLLGTGFNPRKKKLWGFLLGCLLFSGLIFMAACGGSSSSGGGGGGHPGTPAGTYTLTVMGTAPTGSPAHSTNVTLTVN